AVDRPVPYFLSLLEKRVGERQMIGGSLGSVLGAVFLLQLAQEVRLQGVRRDRQLLRCLGRLCLRSGLWLGFGLRLRFRFWLGLGFGLWLRLRFWLGFGLWLRLRFRFGRRLGFGLGLRLRCDLRLGIDAR